MFQTITISVLQLAGLLYIITISNKFLIHAHQCDNARQFNWFGVDCFNTTSTIPEDLDSGIEVIYFYGVDNFTGLKSGAFRKYLNLKWIFLENLTIDEPIYPDILSPLLKLQYLTFKNISYINKEFDIILPKTLRFLNLGNNPYINQLNLSGLINLNFLLLYNCNLTNLPILDFLAPLKIIDLSFNPLKQLLVEEIASYCLLKGLTLRWRSDSLIPTKTHYCQCMRLAEWMKLLSIGNQGGPLNCTSDINLNTNGTNCNLLFSKNIIDRYEKCFEKYGPPPTPPSKFRWIYVIVPAAIIAVIILFYGTYRIFSK